MAASRTVHHSQPAGSMDDEQAFFTLLGATLAGALLLGAAWWRARSRLNQLEDRLISALGNRDGTDVDDRINELAQRVAQLGRGQEFVQHLLSGKRHLPHSKKPIDTTPS
jgi:hypothetical protein